MSFCRFVCLLVRLGSSGLFQLVCFCCCQHCLFVSPIFYSLPVHPTYIELPAGNCIQIMEICFFSLRALTLFGAIASCIAQTKCPPGEQATWKYAGCEPCKPGFLKTTISETSLSCNTDRISWHIRERYVCTNSFGSYDSLQEAKRACLDHYANCRTVYEWRCGGCESNYYNLCKNDGVFSRYSSTATKLHYPSASGLFGSESGLDKDQGSVSRLN